MNNHLSCPANSFCTISKPEDLDGKSQQEIFNLFSLLMANISLLSQQLGVTNVEPQRKHQEIDILRQQVVDMNI